MNSFECKKVETCFSNRAIYEYRIMAIISDELLNLIKDLGILEHHRNFSRPFFQLTMVNGTKIKGIIGENVLKVYFPIINPQIYKREFEEKIKEFEVKVKKYNSMSSALQFKK